MNNPKIQKLVDSFETEAFQVIVAKSVFHSSTMKKNIVSIRRNLSDGIKEMIVDIIKRSFGTQIPIEEVEPSSLLNEKSGAIENVAVEILLFDISSLNLQQQATPVAEETIEENTTSIATPLLAPLKDTMIEKIIKNGEYAYGGRLDYTTDIKIGNEELSIFFKKEYFEDYLYSTQMVFEYLLFKSSRILPELGDKLPLSEEGEIQTNQVEIQDKEQWEIERRKMKLNGSDILLKEPRSIIRIDPQNGKPFIYHLSFSIEQNEIPLVKAPSYFINIAKQFFSNQKVCYGTNKNSTTIHFYGALIDPSIQMAKKGNNSIFLWGLFAIVAIILIWQVDAMKRKAQLTERRSKLGEILGKDLSVTFFI